MVQLLNDRRSNLEERRQAVREAADRRPRRADRRHGGAYLWSHVRRQLHGGFADPSERLDQSVRIRVASDDANHFLIAEAGPLYEGRLWSFWIVPEKGAA